MPQPRVRIKRIYAGICAKDSCSQGVSLKKQVNNGTKCRFADRVHLGFLLFRRKLNAFWEGCSYLLTRPQKKADYWVVSCERNAGLAAIKCLDSVYRQSIARRRIRHVFIDDASTDETHQHVCEWLAEHPDHNVEYIHNQRRLGGTANTLRGFRMAPEDSIVVELNGDDWLADRHVLRFLDKVYASSDVWMTYNTLRYADNLPALWARPVPEDVVAENGFRDMDEWVTSALHTFRRKLFDYIDPETFRDPKTGDYWESADDQAIYLAMLELSGKHARHLYRVTYVYNFRELSHCYYGKSLSEERSLRIRQSAKHKPIDSL